MKFPLLFASRGLWWRRLFGERFMDICDAHKETAVDAYAKAISSGNPPTLTDELLRAILAQLDKLNEQVEALREEK